MNDLPVSSRLLVSDVLSAFDLSTNCYLRQWFPGVSWRVVEIGERAVVLVDRMARARRYIVPLIDITLDGR